MSRLFLLEVCCEGITDRLCLSINKGGRDKDHAYKRLGLEVPAMPVRDCRSKESVFAVSRICSITVSML
jgi:hypothetical protein